MAGRDVDLLTRDRDVRVGVRMPSRAGLALAEWVGLAVALAIALGVTAIVLSTAKSSLILYDGDSQLPLLWRASVWAGQPQEWVLSSPLFLIELALYGPALLLPLPGPMTLALCSVIGFFALYLSGRALTAAMGLRRCVGVVSALGIVAVPAVEALLEQSPDRNALEPAALLMTTTYYSGSIIASVLLLALVVRIVRSAITPKPLVLGAAGALTLVASLSNPLFIAWTVGPLTLILLILGLAGISRPTTFIVGITLVVGAGLGMLARAPFSAFLVQDNAAKVRPDLASQSAHYYLGLVAQRLENPGGPLEALIVVATFLCAVVVLLLAIGRRHAGMIAVAGFAVASPLIVVVASVSVGTFAARYLEPVAFFPPLALASLFLLIQSRSRPDEEKVHHPGRLRAVGTVALVCSLTLSGAFTIFLTLSTTRPDASITCAARWIDNRAKPGAGQYWSVRAVKAAIRNPRNLVQTGPSLNGYSWLTDADDLRTKWVYFTITDAESVPFQTAGEPVTVIRCGQYTIDDYGTHPLKVGPSHH